MKSQPRLHASAWSSLLRLAQSVPGVPALQVRGAGKGLENTLMCEALV